MQELLRDWRSTRREEEVRKEMGVIREMPIRQRPGPPLQEMMDHIQKRIKNGEIISLIFVGLTKDGKVIDGWAGIEWIYPMIGALRCLEEDLLSSMRDQNKEGG